jgi:hypothetical protein
MRPVAVIPMNDPEGVLFPHLETITPLLKRLFARLFVSVPLPTQQALPHYMEWLKTDDFFHAIYHQNDLAIGDDFLTLYAQAALVCDPDQLLHLCFIDRLAYALQSEHRAAFMADVQAVKPAETPLIWQRSARAWQTHPRNYRDIEQMATKAGEWLFGKSLDFAWCHLVIPARRLREVVPMVKNRDMSFFAEIILAIREEVAARDVDWLSWEDPFINSRDGQALKMARESSLAESRKRLAYVIPILRLLERAARSGN